MTRKLVDAGAILGTQVLDHIIVGHNRAYSFADESQLGEKGGDCQSQRTMRLLAH